MNTMELHMENFKVTIYRRDAQNKRVVYQTLIRAASKREALACIQVVTDKGTLEWAGFPQDF